MKRLVIALLIIAGAASLYGQTGFFPSKSGMTLVYESRNASGKTVGYSEMAVKDVSGSGGNMSVTYVASVFDKNRKTVSGGDMSYRVVIKDGVAVMDMNQMIPPELRAQGVKMDVSGTPLEVPGPGNLKPGDRLKPSEITMTMDLGAMQMNTVARTEGKCLAIEEVRVPAGTFTCHKVTQTISTTAMGVNTVQTVLTWYAPGVGQVKTETYDAKNKLVSGSVLLELKGR